MKIPTWLWHGVTVGLVTVAIVRYTEKLPKKNKTAVMGIRG